MGCVGFEMPVRYLNRDREWAFGYIRPQSRKEVRAADINVGVISTEMVFKAAALARLPGAFLSRALLPSPSTKPFQGTDETAQGGTPQTCFAAPSADAGRSAPENVAPPWDARGGSEATPPRAQR